MLYKIIHGLNKKLDLKVFNVMMDNHLIKDLNEEELLMVNSIRDKNLTYLGRKRLASIIYTIKEINNSGVTGEFIEAGCALGGSSILISKMKKQNFSYTIYDMFGLIPAPAENDTADVLKRYDTIVKGESTGIGGEEYYGYRENLQDTVIANLKSFDLSLDADHIKLVKGKVQDTMNIQIPVAFAHIDVDWYNSTITCLEQIWPNLVVGGSIIIDDYDSWGGCRVATDEYFSKYKGQFEKDDRYGSLKVTRIK